MSKVCQRRSFTTFTSESKVCVKAVPCLFTEYAAIIVWICRTVLINNKTPSGSKVEMAYNIDSKPQSHFILDSDCYQHLLTFFCNNCYHWVWVDKVLSHKLKKKRELKTGYSATLNLSPRSQAFDLHFYCGESERLNERLRDEIVMVV